MVAQPDKLELCLLPTSSEDMAHMTSLEERLRQDLRQRVSESRSNILKAREEEKTKFRGAGIVNMVGVR